MPARPLSDEQIETAVSALADTYERQGWLDPESAVATLAEQGLDGTVVETDAGRPGVHPKVRAAWIALMGPAIIWDRDSGEWRKRRKGDPPWKPPSI